jgi:hypothetical protein
MKQGFPKTGLILAAAIGVTVASTNAFGQATYETPPTTPVVTTATAAPALPPAASEVLQLSQAKISDGTIITYIQNSGTIYGLNASQVVYLKQQGVDDAVLSAMLNQRTMLASAPQQPPAMDNSAQTAPPPADTTVAQPSTPAPSSVYVVPDTQTYYYNNWAYPYYYSYPYYYGYYGWPGWGWGYRGGYYGGYHGGYYGGGGYHGGYGGGGFHSGGGGGFHGGVGGGGHR